MVNKQRHEMIALFQVETSVTLDLFSDMKIHLVAHGHDQFGGLYQDSRTISMELFGRISPLRRLFYFLCCTQEAINYVLENIKVIKIRPSNLARTALIRPDLAFEQPLRKRINLFYYACVYFVFSPEWMFG